MIIRGIVLVRSFTNQSHQEIPVDAFIVMKWHEIQIVEAKARGNHEDKEDTDPPRVFRETLLDRRWFLLAIRDRRLFSARFFTAT